MNKIIILCLFINIKKKYVYKYILAKTFKMLLYIFMKIQNYYNYLPKDLDLRIHT